MESPGVGVARAVDEGRGRQRGLALVPVRVGRGAGLAAAFGAVWVIWGSTYLAIAWAVETIPPLMMIGLRCGVAGAVLYGWARMRGGGPRPRAADWQAAAVAGALLFVTGQAVLAWAETRLASGVASLLIATEPLFVALLSWRVAAIGGRTEAPRPVVVAAVVAGFVGVGALVLPGAGSVQIDPWGAAAVVLAALSWSLGIFRAGSRPGIGAAQTAGMQLLTSAAILLAISVAVGEAADLPAGGPSARSLAAWSYLVVFGSVVGFGAYVWLLGRVSPQIVSTHAYVNPLVAVALGTLLNGEPLTPGLLAAGALILGSVALLLRAGTGPRGSGSRRRHAPVPAGEAL